MKKVACRQEDIFCFKWHVIQTLSYTNLSFLLGSFQCLQRYRLSSLPVFILGDRCSVFQQLNILVIFKHSETSLLTFITRPEHASLTEHQKETKWSLETGEEHN